MKHNKKKNIGIIFDLLLKEYLSCSDNNDKKIQIESIILKYFNKDSHLLKEYNIYNILSSIRGMNERDSERYLSLAKNEYKQLNHSELDKQLNLIKEEIGKSFGKEFYDSFIPTYKVYATIYGILNETTENSMEKFELENKILDLMRSHDEKRQEYILEHSDTLVYQQYCKKFNEKYLNLSKSQKILIENYTKSLNDDIDFVLFLNEELHKCNKILTESLKIEKDSTLIEKIELTLKEVKEFQKKNKITNEDFEFVLNLQEVCEFLDKKKLNESFGKNLASLVSSFLMTVQGGETKEPGRIPPNIKIGQASAGTGYRSDDIEDRRAEADMSARVTNQNIVYPDYDMEEADLVYLYNKIQNLAKTTSGIISKEFLFKLRNAVKAKDSKLFYELVEQEKINMETI